MHHRYAPILLLCCSFATSCIQKLDPDLSGGPPVDGEPPTCSPEQGFACNFKVIVETPKVGLEHDPETGDVTKEAKSEVATVSACEKVTKDTLEVLEKKCGSCHDGPENVQGHPLNFITDVARLTVASSTGKAFLGEPYIMPGKPEASLIYQRAVISRDMPKIMPLQPPNFLTVSESSTLREWILNCAGSPVGGAGGGGGAGGMPGVAGAPGAGGDTTMGSGGSSGMAAGGPGTGGGGSAGAPSLGGAGGAAAAGAGAGGASGGSAGRGGGGGGTTNAGSGGVSSGGSSGAAGNGAGGAGTSGAGGGQMGGAPCAGLCMNPQRFALGPTYQSNALGTTAICRQTNSTVMGWNCGNMNGRTININGVLINCAMPPAASALPPRNGGYCIQVTPGGNASAYFGAY